MRGRVFDSTQHPWRHHCQAHKAGRRNTLGKVRPEKAMSRTVTPNKSHWLLHGLLVAALFYGSAIVIGLALAWWTFR